MTPPGILPVVGVKKLHENEIQDEVLTENLTGKSRAVSTPMPQK